MAQFRRSAVVTIGTPGSGGLEITDLRIIFDVNKTDDKDPNKAKIDIYNLSQTSRDRIDKINELVFLSAGYLEGDGIENLFIGNITNISHSRQPPEVITTITADDGAKEIFERKVSFSFDSGIGGREVLRQVLKAFSIPNDFDNLSFTDIEYANGFSFSGMAKDALSKVTEFLNLDWSIQNNEIRLLPFDGNDGTRTVLLSPKTGLIGSPQKESFSTRRAKGKSKKEDIPGWRVRALLQPKIEPGGQVVLSSKDIEENSVFTVMNIDHFGDTEGQDWRSEIEIKE